VFLEFLMCVSFAYNTLFELKFRDSFYICRTDIATMAHEISRDTQKSVVLTFYGTDIAWFFLVSSMRYSRRPSLARRFPSTHILILAKEVTTR
jgi:hypothetical protein